MEAFYSLAANNDEAAYGRELVDNWPQFIRE